MPSFELPLLRIFLRPLAGLALAGAMLWPVAANAAEPVAEPAPRLEARWYGWQTLVNDGASALLLTAGAFSTGAGSTAIVATGLVTYSLGGPVIHFVHKNPGRGIASFALRVPMPIAMAAGTVAVVCHDSAGDFCAFVAIPGALVGIAAAIILDAAALARDEVPNSVARPTKPSAFAHFRITPTFSITHRETTFGLAISL